MAHSQEADQLHHDLKDLKAKWDEMQDVVTASTERESAFIEKINDLEEGLCLKTEKTIAAEEKRAKMKERLKKVLEKNREHVNTNTALTDPTTFDGSKQ